MQRKACNLLRPTNTDAAEIKCFPLHLVNGYAMIRYRNAHVIFRPVRLK